MTNTIADHEIILGGIKPEYKIDDKEYFINFFSSDRYQRIGQFEPSERYPHGATTHGSTTIKHYPERNGWEAMIEDHKFHTQNSHHTYQMPRKLFFHHFIDKDGFGHTTLTSNFGTHMQGVVTHSTKNELSILMHGNNEHNGVCWVKIHFKKDNNGCITAEVSSCNDHTSEWELMQTLELKPIS